MIDSWIIFAILFSIFLPLSGIVAEYSKARVLHFLMWQRVFMVLIFSPILFFIPWPTDPVFYGAIAFGAILFCYGDLITFSITARDGAGVVARVEPLSSWIVFAMWFVASPLLLLEYLDTPIRFAGIIVSLTGVIFFSLRLRQCGLSWGVVKRLFPILIIDSIAIISSKIALDHSDLHAGVFYYCLVQCTFMAVLYALCLRFKTLPTISDLDRGGRLFGRQTLLSGFLMAIALALTLPMKHYSMSLAENPAYVLVFSLLAPFWISLIYRLLKRREDVDVISGFGIVICTALMVMFTQF